MPDACKRFGSLLELWQVQASSEQFERPNMVCERGASGRLHVVGESMGEAVYQLGMMMLFRFPVAVAFGERHQADAR